MKKTNTYMLFFIILCICITSLFSIVVTKAVNSKRSLFGKIIYVDAGHGGNDNGASFYGVLEDEINLKISKYIVENLIDLGAYVLSTRTNDYDLSDIYEKNKKRHDLINRVRQINQSRADLFVSVHLNSYSSNNVKGGQVFHQSNDKSKKLAETIQKNLNILQSSKDRKIKLGDYYILNKSNVIGAIVECGFLSNDEERSMLVTSVYQQKIANKIVDGIVDYFVNVED